MSRHRSSIVTILILFVTTTAFAAGQRSFVSGKFALDLEGSPAGLISSIAGGFASGNVVSEADSPDFFFKKHLEDPPGYSDITIQCGTNMSPAFYQWLKNTLSGAYPLHNGAILALDYQNKVLRRLEFVNAQITRITFPRVDAASKDTATLTVTLTPASTFAGTKGVIYNPGSAPTAKKWVASNFKLTIVGLDTTHITSIEAIDIPIPLAPPPDLACLVCVPIPPRIDFPQVQVALSETYATTWSAWDETFVISGQHTDADEKSATLDYLDATLHPLVSLNLTGLGIISVSNDPAAAGNQTVSVVRATMYSEKIAMTLP